MLLKNKILSFFAIKSSCLAGVQGTDNVQIYK